MCIFTLISVGNTTQPLTSSQCSMNFIHLRVSEWVYLFHSKSSSHKFQLQRYEQFMAETIRLIVLFECAASRKDHQQNVYHCNNGHFGNSIGATWAFVLRLPVCVCVCAISIWIICEFALMWCECAWASVCCLKNSTHKIAPASSIGITCGYKIIPFYWCYKQNDRSVRRIW